jgi:peptidyl-prolyl cis-trans isomerase SurA
MSAAFLVGYNSRAGTSIEDGYRQPLPLPRKTRKQRKNVYPAMAVTFPFLSALRRLTFVLTILATAIAATTRAEAQFVAVIVNGDPVTNFDIEQRSKLAQLATHKSPVRKEVIEELINEKLKLQLIRRYNIPDLDKDVDNAFANMARRSRQTPAQFSEQLGKAGIKTETIKSRIRADLIWSQIIRGRYQSSFQFSDKDIQARLDAKKPDNANVVGYDYTLRPILFVVARGSPPAAFEARVKEAESLRARFESCEQGLAIARNIRFVAVRPPVVKGSADLAPALREILAKTEIGHLTPPETTREGVEIYAICSKRQSDNAPAKKEVRDQMYQEAFNSHATQFLKELRSQAMIEYR